MPSAAVILPSFVTPILTHIDEPEVGPDGLEHLVAAHHDLDRAAGHFCDSSGRDRFEIDDGLAAEPAADLGRGHAQVADRHVRAAWRSARGRRNGPGSTPRSRPGRRHRRARSSGVRLDIGLVHRGGLELLLDRRHRPRQSPASRSPILNSSRFEMLEGLVGAGSTPRVIMSSNKQRRVGLHRLVDIDDVRQHLVIDLDQRQRPPRRSRRRSRRRRRRRGPHRAPSRAPSRCASHARN